MKNNYIKGFSIRRLIIYSCVIVLFVEIGVSVWPWVKSHVYVDKKERILRMCQEADLTKVKLCWEKIVKDAIKKGDIDGAFTALAILYDANPSMGETCHSLTHEIGQTAYTLFARNRDFRVSPKTAYCSYGFYHGFMEALVTDRGDMELARKFCSYVDKQLATITPDATLQCYHGIGHGTVNNHDPRTWGREELLVNPALALCESVASSEDQRSRCATGVFNGLSIFYTSGEYKLVLKTDDPLWVCRQQKPQYQDACYISMNTLLLQLTNMDLAKAAQFIEAISDDTMARHAMINIASPIGSKNIDASDHQEVVNTCRQMQPRLRLACIQGYAYGFLEHGIPEQEYVKSLAFCESNQINTEEQNACFEYILSYLPMWYGNEKVMRICQKLDEPTKSKCIQKAASPKI